MDNKDLLMNFEQGRGVPRVSIKLMWLSDKINSKWEMPWSTATGQWEPAFVGGKNGGD